MTVPGLEGPIVKIMAKRIGRQRLRRVVARVVEADGTPIHEILGCGHELRPPPKVERSYRLCQPCEERLGRVMARLGRDPVPEEVDLLDTVIVGERREIAKLKRRVERLKAEVLSLRAVMPRPEVGKDFAGRTVLEIQQSGVVWAPTKLLIERHYVARGIKHHATRTQWALLCTEAWSG